jgi:alpha-ketoglutarate-dependent 2,4-dichlorophenoxyacetate dioxygenase
MSSTTTLISATPSSTVSLEPTLTVIKNGFGAEITDLDFANGVTDEAYQFIREAVTKVVLLSPKYLD